MAGNKHEDLTNDPNQPQDGGPDALTPGPDGTAWSNPDVTGNANRGYYSVGVDGGSGAVVSPQFNLDVERFRRMGAERTPSVNLDQTNISAARGLQMNGLGLLRSQAEGSAPSSAAILSQRANQDAIRQAAMRTTGAKSAAGGIVASRAGGEAAGAAMLAGNAQNADRRAAEIARGQTGFASGAGAVMGQDIQASTVDAQLEAQQRALEEHRQQTLERMAFEARRKEMDAANEAGNQETLRMQRERAARDADAQADFNKTKDTLAWSTSLSDPRTKQNVVPMGSLSSLVRGRR